MVSRVRVVDSAKVEAEVRLEVAAVAQTADGLRVKMHDKHGPLVSIGSVRGTRNRSGRIRISGKRRESVRPRDLLHARTPKHIIRTWSSESLNAAEFHIEASPSARDAIACRRIALLCNFALWITSKRLG